MSEDAVVVLTRATVGRVGGFSFGGNLYIEMFVVYFLYLIYFVYYIYDRFYKYSLS